MALVAKRGGEGGRREKGAGWGGAETKPSMRYVGGVMQKTGEEYWREENVKMGKINKKIDKAIRTKKGNSN